MSASPLVMCGGFAFSVLPPCCPWPTGPGVYMFCRQDVSGSRWILYIGEASSLADRVGPEHERWAEALSLGMNQVLVHLLAMTKAERLAVETRLRHLHPTPLNRQPAGIGLLSHFPTQGLMNALGEALARPQRPPAGGIFPYRSPFEAD